MLARGTWLWSFGLALLATTLFTVIIVGLILGGILITLFDAPAWSLYPAACAVTAVVIIVLGEDNWGDARWAWLLLVPLAMFGLLIFLTATYHHAPENVLRDPDEAHEHTPDGAGECAVCQSLKLSEERE